MFKIEMLPGNFGDALWIEYGDASSPNRILVDGGAPMTGEIIRSKILALPEDQRRFELVMVSHIDLDHISGILELLEKDTPAGLVIDDFWFNGYKQLPETPGVLGAKQGERLSYWIEHHDIPINKAFGGGAVMIPDDLSTLPEINLPGGMKMTILSPTLRRLIRLKAEWEKTIKGLEMDGDTLIPGQAGAILAGHAPELAGGVLGDLNIELLSGLPFKKDTSRPNGSSIVTLAQYEGKSLLLTGDSFANDLSKAIDQHLSNTGAAQLELDAWKLAHHGGKKNTSHELIQRIKCSRFLLPTSGAYYNHPNPETLARVITDHSANDKIDFYFNYRSEDNEDWDDNYLRNTWNYRTHYPPNDQPGMKVIL